MENSHKALNFLRNHWVEIAMTWNAENDSNCITLREAKMVAKEKIPKGKYWSCFFVPELIRDIYQIARGDNSKPILIDDIAEFDREFTPGYIYEFEISDHVFVMIYEADGRIYYVDYYMETGRGCRQIGKKNPEAFRLETIDRQACIKYLTSYLAEDFDTFVKFNKGDEEYKESYVKEYYSSKKNWEADNKDYHLLHYTKYPITMVPTVTSVVRTILQYPPSEGLIEENVQMDPITVRQYKKTYHKVLRRLISHCPNEIPRDIKIVFPEE